MSDPCITGGEEQDRVYPNALSIPPASESLSTVGTDGVIANTDPDAPQNEVPPPDPITTYGRPHCPEVSYDKLHLYQPSQLAASRMYNKQYCAPIALLCMSIGVPLRIHPDAIESDECFKKALTSGKGGMFTKTQLIPTNKTSGKKFLQKELLRRAIIADPSCSSLPQPAAHSIKTLVNKLLEKPPPPSEHDFILSAIDHLKEDMRRHFQSHSGTAEASLNRWMRFIEVLMDPSIKRDWLERGMQKNRPVIDAECSHSAQCQTNDHLTSFWDKAVLLYNDKEKSYKSRVYLDYGKPFDKSVTIHPVGQEYHMQADSLKKKYTESRGIVDKIRVNLTKSGEGEGSIYSGDQVRSYTNTEHDAYMYLVLQEEGQVSDFAQSFDKKHSASSSRTPKTVDNGSNTKKQKRSDTPTSSLSGAVDAIENLTYSIANFRDTTRTNDRLRDLQELLRSDENSLMLRQTEMISVSDQYANILDDVDQGRTTKDSIRFVARQNAYESCKNQITILQLRIQQTNQNIEKLNIEIENTLVTPKKNLEEGIHNNVDEFNVEDEYESPRNPFEEDEVDGHEGVDIGRILGDDEIDDAEEFDD